MCEDLAPLLFEVTEDGELVVRESHPDPAQWTAARAAAHACPTGAITLIEDE
jgi:ferredoxin